MTSGVERKMEIQYIAPRKKSDDSVTRLNKLKRVAAYCRVSTDERDQINSYENQMKKYTDKILSEPGWKMVGIFADRGISGTSTKNRDEFNKMIRLCKKGKIDIILVKSVSRFARNNLDTLSYTRKLRQLGVDVYFEEQNIHSIDPASDFMISLHGSLAQSESESLSANVKWGKMQSAKNGKIPINYACLLGYRKGKDGLPEIVPDEAYIIRYIYNMFLDGESYKGICDRLAKEGFVTTSPSGKWYSRTIESILRNVKYKGDVITNQTYVTDPISKRVKRNDGEVGQYYIKNHHPAIIDDDIFDRVQEEIARRNNMKKRDLRSSKTGKGRYDSRFALSELMVCGICGSPYQRRTWTQNGENRKVWRCAKRVAYGKKYCKCSPAVDEKSVEAAIMRETMAVMNDIDDVITSFDDIVSKGITLGESAGKILEIQSKIDELNDQAKEMMDSIVSDPLSTFDEVKYESIVTECRKYEEQIQGLANLSSFAGVDAHRLCDIKETIKLLRNAPLEYDNRLIKKIVSGVIVLSKHSIEIHFVDGRTVISDL